YFGLRFSAKAIPKGRCGQGVGKFEIGRKPISNPKAEISNWTDWPLVFQFKISDFGFEMGFRPISKCLSYSAGYSSEPCLTSSSLTLVGPTSDPSDQCMCSAVE